MKDEILIVSNNSRNCESNLIQGALWYYNLPSRVLNYSEIEKIEKNLEKNTLVVHTTRKEKNDIFPAKDGIDRTFIIAGHSATLEFLHQRYDVSENEILIYGEPYSIIPKLVKNKELLDKYRGKVILGSIFDPKEYKTPLTQNGEFTYIMTSMGCEKKCGYCSYGSTFSHLYGKKFSRRSRPWIDIKKELISFMENGTNKFYLIADQFLSTKPEENRELFGLASNWDAKKNGRPLIIFTIFPIEVLNNKLILDLMHNSFKLYPRFSIDSFDNATLKLFDLKYDSNTALEALKYITELELPFRLNYIFLRPGMTIENLKKEFSYFKSLVKMVSYFTPYEKLLLAHDIFSRKLKIIHGSPIYYKMEISQMDDKVSSEVSEVLTKVYQVMGEELKKFEADDKGDPLKYIINTGYDEIMRLS